MKIPQDKCAWPDCAEAPLESSGVWVNFEPPIKGMSAGMEMPLCPKHLRALQRTYAPKPGEMSFGVRPRDCCLDMADRTARANGADLPICADCPGIDD